MANYIDTEKERNDWINIFYNGLFNKSKKPKEYKKCLKFKNSKVPTSLFKYTRVERAYYLLNRDLMFLCKFNNLNDPFEGNFLHDEELYQKRKTKLEIDNSYKEEYRVTCFSEDNANAPMWAFYADNHKGICIEYNLHENSHCRDFCLPVQYVTKTDNVHLTETLLDNEDPRNVESLELFVKKAKYWSYEREWRLIFDDKYNYEEFTFHLEDNKKYLRFLKPKAVYMGLEITSEDEDFIKYLCKERNIDVYKMRKDAEDYKLIPEKVL